MRHYLGIDLGGTNVKVGVLSDDGDVLAKVSTPTHADEGPPRVVESMLDAARRATQQAQLTMEQIDAIGIGTPGPSDFERGIVISAPNMPDFRNIPLRDLISKGTGRPAVLENDANAAAFGEYWLGAGHASSIKHMVMLTLGTGVGAGIIIDGTVIHGAKGLAAEGGHMIIEFGGRQCGCGQRGCLEAYASASSTAARAREAIAAEGVNSSLKQLADPAALTCEDVFAAADAGDAVAQQVVAQTCEYLGAACVNFCRLFDTQMIVFAGGMILAGDVLFEQIRAAFARQTWHAAPEHVQIVPARLGNDAGLIGAAAVARDAHQRGRLHEATR